MVLRGAISAILFVVVALLGDSAVAADLAVKAQPTVAAPVEYLGGFYIGAEGGYGWNTGNSGTLGADLGDLSSGAQGAVFGLYSGWGQRFGNAYLGVEGNGDWSHIAGNSGVAGVAFTNNTNWLASARTRFGWFIATNSLLYGTLGYGWGGNSLAVVDSNDRSLGTKSVVGNGWVWGGGLETPFFFPAVRTRLQYLQYNLGTNSVACTCDAPIVFQQKSAVHTVTLGIQYDF